MIDMPNINSKFPHVKKKSWLKGKLHTEGNITIHMEEKDQRYLYGVYKLIRKRQTSQFTGNS